MNRMLKQLFPKPFNVCHYCNISFVPSHRKIKSSDLDFFTYFLENHKKMLILTGAGMSTECGLPDYRSELVGLYARRNHKPMQYQEFLKSDEARKRYWARSFLGWPRFSECEPSSAMQIIAEQLQKTSRIVTQNVDGLHLKAGSKDVIELHGSVHRVVCLGCGNLCLRSEVQDRLLAVNKDMNMDIGAIRPDGDVDINEEQVKHFKIVNCNVCQGILKPDIVFFGDNVPQQTAKAVERLVEMSDSLLVLGSSLTVYSSYRIIVQAHKLKKYIFIVNIGSTRGDSLANLKLNVKIGDLFDNCPLFL